MEPWVWTAIITAVTWLFLQLSGGPPDEAQENVKIEVEARISSDCEQDASQEPCDGVPHEGWYKALSDGDSKEEAAASEGAEGSQAP